MIPIAGRSKSLRFFEESIGCIGETDELQSMPVDKNHVPRRRAGLAQVKAGEPIQRGAVLCAQLDLVHVVTLLTRETGMSSAILGCGGRAEHLGIQSPHWMSGR